MNLIVTAVLVQRTSGGNLAEILDNVGEQMREKERLFGEVRTMTSQQRFSGTVHDVLADAAAGALLAGELGPDEAAVHDDGRAGRCSASAAVLQMLGYFTISRILDVEI